MTFAWPLLLFSVPLVGAGATVVWLLGRRRVRTGEAFGRLQVISLAPARLLRLRRRIVTSFYLAALLVLAVAAARPQSVVSLPVSEGTVILAFDVSASMAADDLKPTRMEAAKAAARAFVERQPPSVVVGVVAFSDSGFSVQAPTNESATVIAAIDRLAPQRGTSIGRGITDSLQAIALAQSDPAEGYYTNRTPAPSAEPTPVPPGTHTSAAIVLLTDGENNERPDPLQAAQAAADRGIRIYPIGVGSPQGADVRVDGFTVHSQLDEATLQQVAAITGGEYFAAASSAELSNIYDELDPQLTFKPQTTELTAILGGFGLALAAIGGLAALAWTGRLP